jgi:hypothetical protein
MIRRLAARAAASWPCLAAGAWLIGSILVYEHTGLDVRLPCLVKLVFGVGCPGCGMTGALQALLHADPATAWARNPLIFVVLPAGFCYGVRAAASGRERSPERFEVELEVRDRRRAVEGAFR